MEKKEIKNVDTSNGIYTENVCIGVVSLIKVADKDENTKGSVIDQSTTKKVVALDIRKIAFSANYGAGKDLFYSLSRNNPYCYEYIDNNDFVNNTLVIRKTSQVNGVLNYAGFDEELDSSDLRGIKKMLLSKGNTILIKEHEVELPELIVPSTIELINDQAGQLSKFKKLSLPTRPQRIEKVYNKYFK